MRWTLSALFALMHSVGAELSRSETPYSDVTLEPRICVGFNPETGQWGSSNPPELDDFRCAEDHAVMGVSLEIRTQTDPERVRIVGPDCCPLPHGMLTHEHSYNASECPPDSVTTGYRRLKEVNGGDVELLRCTKLGARFRLAPSAPGQGYGAIESSAWATILGIPSNTSSRGQLPAALRYGLSRISRTQWRDGGCVGQIPGALLVSKRRYECSGYSFAEVLEAADSPQGPGSAHAALPVLPECDAIDNPFLPRPTCLKSNRH